MGKKIDVIIPAFKAQNTIARTLASIVIQSIVDQVKVTIVNDADGIGYKDFVKHFSPYIDIEEITMETNGGPGVARQFGIDNTTLPYDWINPQNDDLWQGLNGINNPCPPGWIIPDIYDLFEEQLKWSESNYIGAFNSPLKLTLSGSRTWWGGNLTGVGLNGVYWSSTTNNIYSGQMFFDDSEITLSIDRRSNGFSIRCIKYYNENTTKPLIVLNTTTTTTTKFKVR